MNENIKKIKKVISEITDTLYRDTAKYDYNSYSTKIRAIEHLLHAIAILET